MGMRPEEMERWGTASIFKESARLLHKHYRLFLPFFVAFYLPLWIAAVYQIVFVPPSTAPLLDASVVKGAFNTAQTTDPPDEHSFTINFSVRLVDLLNYVVGTLGTGAVFYITAYLYTPTDTDDNRSIVLRVFKLLPHAFLRVFTTDLWTFLAFLLLYLLSVIIVGILYAIMSATAGWSDPSLLLFALFPALAGTIFLVIVFALAQVIAVLEPGNYGGEALKRSTKLVRIGRAWTIVAVTLTGIALSAVPTVLTPGIQTGGMPVWAKVVLGVAIEGLDSVSSVYFGVVSVVMYFVYKARFDAAETAGIPVFKRIDSAEHSYDPIVEGKGSVTYIGEP